jgi:cobaltochelatase CobT
MTKPERVASFLPPSDPDLDREAMTARDFEEGTKTAVRTISTDFKTDVRFEGSAAATNGDQVRLPSNPPEAMLTYRQVHVGRGFANHESLHKLLTDFAHGKKKLAEWDAAGQRMSRHMAQAIEDVRIEHGGTYLYPGMAKSIDKTASYVCRKFVEEHLVENPELKDDIDAMLPLAVTWAGRLRLGYPSPEIKAAYDQLGDTLKTKADQVVDATMALPHGVTGVGQVDQKLAHKGSRDGMALAEMIADERKKEREKEREKKPGEEGEEGEGGGEAKEGEPGETAGRGASNPSGEPDASPFDPNLDDAVMELITADHESKEFRPYTREDDRYYEVDEAIDGYYDYGLKRYADTRHQISSNVATMRRKLERALISKQERDWEVSRSGRLDVRRRSMEIVRGKDDIYKKRSEGEGINAAVSILIDMSGSMSGQKADLAQQATIALAEALEGTGVPYEILGFQCTSFQSSTSKRMREDQARYAAEHSGRKIMWDREEACVHHGFKPFGMNLKRCKPYIGLLSAKVGGNNGDADALLFAAARLVKRSEDKKVLLVLSDGWPAWYGSYSRTERDCDYWTRAAAERVRELGIQMVGIGIMDEAVKKFYPRHVVLHSVEDLGKTVLDQVAKLLLGERFHVDNAELVKTDRSAVRALGR